MKVVFKDSVRISSQTFLPITAKSEVKLWPYLQKRTLTTLRSNIEKD